MFNDYAWVWYEVCFFGRRNPDLKEVAMHAIQCILHPTDFSDCSDYALDIAALLARESNARLVVLHVAVPRIPVYGDGIVSNVSEAFSSPTGMTSRPPMAN
jgi:hypothetical protein